MNNNWASSHENLSSGCLTKRVSNQSPQLQRLGRKLKFTCSKCTYATFQKANNRERSGSVVECFARDREAMGSSLTGVTALWSLSKTHLS